MADLYEKHGIKPPRTIHIGNETNSNIDYENLDKYIPVALNQQASSQADRFRKENPLLSKIAELGNKGVQSVAETTATHPNLAKIIEVLGKGGDVANEYFEMSGIPNVAGGFLQGLGNMGLSAGNLALQPFTGNKETVPYLDFKQYLKPEEQDSLAFSLGNLASGLIPMGAASRLSEVARPRGYMGILSDVLKGAGAGALFGGEGDNRLLGAAIGGPASAVVSNTASKIANRISGDKRALHQAFSQMYDNLYTDAAESGADLVNPVNLSRVERRNLRRGTTSNERAGLYDYLRNPNLRTANEAQSDMGKLWRELDRKRRSPSGLNTAERRAMEEAQRIQERIIGEIDNSFASSGRPDLGQRYTQIRNDYRQYMVPYDEFAPLSSYEAHRRTPAHAKKFLKDINKPDNISSLDFMSSAGEHYPEAQLYESIRKALPWVATAGGGAAATYFGAPSLKHYLRNE